MAKITHLQQLIYEGYLGADPEMRYLDNGTPVTNFRIGSSRSYKQNDNDVSETTWLKVVAWNKLAEIVNQYCAKGSHVIVIGRLRPGANGNPEVFETKAGGHGAAFEVVADTVRIIKGKPMEGNDESKSESDPIPF